MPETDLTHEGHKQLVETTWKDEGLLVSLRTSQILFLLFSGEQREHTALSVTTFLVSIHNG